MRGGGGLGWSAELMRVKVVWVWGGAVKISQTPVGAGQV